MIPFLQIALALVLLYLVAVLLQLAKSARSRMAAPSRRAARIRQRSPLP